MKNKRLAAAVANVVNATTPAQYIISMTFMGPSGSNFTYKPLIIDSLVVKQMFVENVMDDIVVTMSIASSDYAKMFDVQQDLTCSIILKNCDVNGNIPSTQKPTILRYRAIMINPVDPRRQVTDAAYRTEIDRKIKLRLVEDAIYSIRHKLFYGIIQSQPLTNACRAIAVGLGIQNLHMVNSDNTHTFDHIVLPPSTTIMNAYSFLQSKYGVYSCGMSSYFTAGVLYVYRPYDTNPSFPYALSVYQADQGAYAGNGCFYSKSDTGLKVVTNEMPHTKDLSVMGAENHGTGFVFTRASQMTDGVVSTDANGETTYDNDVSISMSLKNPRLSRSDAVNQKYKHITDNPWKHMSDIIKGQALMLTFKWPHAVLFGVYPGGKVSYYSDHDKVIAKRDGIIESAEYLLERGQRGPNGYIFNCMGSITLRLSPEAVDVTSV